MKWIALLFLVVLVPTLSAWLSSRPRHEPWLWTLLAFMPFVFIAWRLGISPYAIPTWSGYAKGWSITVIDAVAFSILLAGRGRLARPYFLVAFSLYLLACIIAMAQAMFWPFSFAYVTQLVRVLILMLAIGKIAQSEEGRHALLRGLVLGLCVQVAYSLPARLGGSLQNGGSLGHQNLLGFVSHMALLPVFATLLAGRYPRLAMVGTLAGLIAVVLTGSRATILLGGAGLAMVTVLSIMLKSSGRKVGMAALGAILMAGAAPFAISSLQERLARNNSALLAEDGERIAFENAARSMIADHPWGVGPNHYTFIANTQGYSERAGVFWGSGSRSTAVHNTYLLIRAETGWLGLMAMFGLIAASLLHAVRSFLAIRSAQFEPSLVLGSACALFLVYIHCLVEWMFVFEPAQYFLGMTFGILAGYLTQVRRERGTRPASASRHTAPLQPAYPRLSLSRAGDRD